jgi:hypothetical protein
MVWFKKGASKEGLPELPPLSLPAPLGEEEKPSEEKISSLQTLPSLPSSLAGERISRETVKQLIEEPEEIESRISIPRRIEVQETPFRLAERTEEKGPIFIQIERYNDVLKDLDEAKSKVDKIHNIIKDIKQFKEEEENEIIEWENEMSKIKGNLDKIDQTIFKKLK